MGSYGIMRFPCWSCGALSLANCPNDEDGPWCCKCGRVHCGLALIKSPVGEIGGLVHLILEVVEMIPKRAGKRCVCYLVLTGRGSAFTVLRRELISDYESILDRIVDFLV